MLFPRSLILASLIVASNLQRVPSPKELEESGLDPDAFDRDVPTDIPTDIPTTTTSTTTSMTTTLTTTLTTTTLTANKTTTNKFIKRVAQAIKEEIVDEWTPGEISGLASGVVSIVAFLIWLTYTIVTYVRNEEDVTFCGLMGHLLGLAFEHFTRVRPQDINQARLGRAVLDNDANEARVRRPIEEA